MSFDYDLFIIGAGSVGLAAAERIAAYGARVAIAEQSAVGGACINYGCISGKSMAYASSKGSEGTQSGIHLPLWSGVLPRPQLPPLLIHALKKARFAARRRGQGATLSTSLATTRI